ncbi:hypothetical protein EDC04DRAFT_2597872 [Pisolithus marmoratus]|nr:hypothetical protein EDC04DRAFT_2597872 [Pisolithus marmoratus]
MSPDDGRMPEHYIGSVTTSTSHTLTNAAQEVPALNKQANQYTSCPSTLCLYTDPEGWECLELINCGTAADHFKDAKSSDTITSDTSVSITSGTIESLLTQTKPSYGWEDVLLMSLKVWKRDCHEIRKS